MARHRIIQGVLHNFLGTYTSRYSDFGGYYLFGFLVDDIEELRIDMIEESSERNQTTPMAKARRLAVTKFAEQTEKAGLPRSFIREAHLDITKSPGFIDGFINGRLAPGYCVTFVATAVTDVGRTYKSTLSIFIAPHDPAMERRSSRN